MLFLILSRKDLLKNHPSASIILGVTAMIHRLCSSENCDKISSVAKVVTAFNDYLGPKCRSGDEKKILTALKAFGNMGYHGKAHRNIIECAESCSKSIKVRLAAIESFRRIDKKRPDEFLQIYSNTNEDYEVRIAIFASMVKHADEEQLQQIAEVAENETDEQVSSYVYTFLKNMGKTPFPSKQKTRKMIQNLKIRQPNENYWKNSKHIEVSGFSKLMAIGGAIEADIIQEPNTKLPRSVYTRLDVDLFGRNFNLLEFGVRAEKLEDILNRFVELKQELSKKKLRNLFGIKSLLGDTNTELSLFVRTMNAEVFDLSTSDLIALREVMARQKDFDLSHSFVFMNSKLVLPSITGRSYSIDLTGSSTVGLTAKSKFDLLSLPGAGDVRLQFQPRLTIIL
ncbi:Apolipophorin [Araneus ventricosus]|uniref:Apolipophorin n=1 Tax=Araneus ventricosus TaxID=182803 RepID=A0A4Y2CNC9_ARAVE|nr:Apolipophorin [Araneus ventricosus]